MVARHAEDLRLAAHAEGQTLVQVLEGALVVGHAEVAEAAQRPTWPGFRLEGQEAAEGRARVGVAVGLVEERGQVPPAFVPSWPQLHALAVKADRLLEVVALPRPVGPARHVRERRGGDRRGRCRGEEHAGDERDHGRFLAGAGTRGSPR